MLGFGADQIRTLVSMATESSDRIIIGKTASSRFLKHFFIFSYLQVMMTFIRAWMSSKSGWIRPRTTEIAALKRLEKKSHRHIMGKTTYSHFLRYFSSDPFHTCR